MEINIYVDDELLEQKSNNEIYTLFQKSVYVKTLSQIPDENDDKVDVNLTLNEYQVIQDLKVWETIDINELQVRVKLLEERERIGKK